MSSEKKSAQIYRINPGKDAQTALQKIEKALRKNWDCELIPYAKNTPYLELTRIIKDRNGPWKTPLYFVESSHSTRIGAMQLCRKTKEFLEQTGEDMDILSVSAGVSGMSLHVVCLLRIYTSLPDFEQLGAFLGEIREIDGGNTDKLIIPQSAYYHYTDQDIAEFQKLKKEQEKAFSEADEEMPFLNRIEKFVPEVLPKIDDLANPVYDLKTVDMQISPYVGYEAFIEIFKECMRYITSVEKNFYYQTLRGNTSKKEFNNVLSAYIDRDFLSKGRLPMEDLPALQAKLDRALFDLYIVQDLIDDPDITDVKITAPDDIRVRVKGRAYMSNIVFIDEEDYYRFIQMVCIKNNVDMGIPAQRFTDDFDEHYRLRFSLTAAYVTGSGFPVIHIRKVARKKPLAKELMDAGMFDEKIRDYLLYCGRNKTGIVFAGPPGSGKTTCLNWFIEDGYESSAEILIIQESNELFAYRRGVTIENVVMNPKKGERKVTLEDLGEQALVNGCNVFVIGESKGAEMIDAIRLANSGCRAAITMHSESSVDTISKMTDLAQMGYGSSYTREQAMRTLKSFQVIVYLQDFKVMSIVEIDHFSEEKKEFVFKYIYRRPAE